MALQKFGDAESAEVFRGREAAVVTSHMQRLGKAVSDFDDNEKQALQAELESVREPEDQPEPEAPPEQKDEVLAPGVEDPHPEREKKGRASSKPAARKEESDGTGDSR